MKEWGYGAVYLKGKVILWVEKDDISCLMINPFNAKLNPICHLLALLGAHHFLHVSRIRVKHCDGEIWRNNRQICS